jgi:hypothetical protein
MECLPRFVELFVRIHLEVQKHAFWKVSSICADVRTRPLTDSSAHI